MLWTFRKTVLNIQILQNEKIKWNFIESKIENLFIGNNVKLYEPYKLFDVIVGQYTYIAQNATISKARIGKFCSIGPNFLCGWGVHPTNGISTAPMFYSALKQNGMTLSSINKIEERKTIYIGNDVFIGMNVTVLDGVTIGDGAIIGAGAVVSKDIPPYAIAVGSSIKIIKYRFSEGQIEKLLKIKWWDFDEDKLQDIEKYFFDVDAFINKYADSQTLHHNH
ncbi:MAG: CatB-related O-acetyltransferase [Chitinophagaceae bacterium]|nr:CatB-related O-acetyltransferase [Chitinophagaceae bacterium]MCW5905660.1 CatB-related O-acetyltransferase [Chitinophagaceae bacterium]